METILIQFALTVVAGLMVELTAPTVKKWIQGQTENALNQHLLDEDNE